MSVDDIDNANPSSNSRSTSSRGGTANATDQGSKSRSFREVLADKRSGERGSDDTSRRSEEREKERRKSKKRRRGRGKKGSVRHGREIRRSEQKRSRRSDVQRRGREMQTQREQHKRTERNFRERARDTDRRGQRGSNEVRREHQKSRRRSRNAGSGRRNVDGSDRRSKAGRRPDRGTRPKTERVHSSSRRSGRDGSVSAAGADGPTSEEASRARRSAGSASDVERSQRTEQQERIRRIADEVVRAARTGTDPEGRDLVMLDVDVPGRGEVRVQLRRQGKGFETRFQTSDEQLARELRRNESELRNSAAERGVQLTSIEVV